MVFRFLSLNGNISQQSVSAKNKILRAFVPFASSTSDFLDFNSEKSLFFKLSSALSEANIIIVGVNNENYIKFKKVFSRTLSFNIFQSEEIKERITASSILPGDELERLVDAHATATEGSDIMFSEDGLFCGTALVSNGQAIILLPLDDDRIDYMLSEYVIPFLKTKTSVSHQTNKPFNKETVSNAVNTLLKFNMTVCFANTQTANLLKDLSKDTYGFLTTFSFLESELPRTNVSPKQYAADLAKNAKANSSATFGASITKVFKTDDPSERMFVYICVADDDTAKIRRIFAEPDENPLGLINAAMEAVCSLIADKANETALQRSENIKFESVNKAEIITKSSHKALSIIIACLILLSILFCVIIGLFIADQSKSSKNASNALVLGESVVFDKLTASGEMNLAGGVDLPDFMINKSDEIIFSETDKAKSNSSKIKEAAKGKFVFTVYGYGHGVGMSLRGAKAYAEKGWSYDNILLNYYPGTVIISTKDEAYPETLVFNGKAYPTQEAIARICIAEIGSSAHREALKAQAIATYTYLRALNNDFTTNNISEVAFSTDVSDSVLSGIEAIISTVDGYYMTYEDKTAYTVFCTMSAGRTSSATCAWGVDLPYLTSVDSSVDKGLPQYCTSLTYSAEEFKTKFESVTGKTLSGDPASWISIVEQDNSVENGIGYVSKIKVGSDIYRGTTFRNDIIGDATLRSPCFSVEYIAD